MTVTRSTRLLFQAAFLGGVSLLFMGTAAADTATQPSTKTADRTITNVVDSSNSSSVVSATTTNNDGGGSSSAAPSGPASTSGSSSGDGLAGGSAVSAQTTQAQTSAHSDSPAVLAPSDSSSAGTNGAALLATGGNTTTAPQAATADMSAVGTVAVSPAVHSELMAMADYSLDTHAATLASPVAATDFSALAATSTPPGPGPAAPKVPTRPLSAVGEILAIFASARIPALIDHALAASFTPILSLATTLLTALVFGLILGFIFSFGYWLRSTGYLSASRDGLPQLGSFFFATPYRLGYVSASAPFA